MNKELVRTMKVDADDQIRVLSEKRFLTTPELSGDFLIFDFLSNIKLTSVNRRRAFINLLPIGSQRQDIEAKRFNLRKEKSFSIRHPFVAPTFVACEVGNKIFIMDFLNVQQFKKDSEIFE